MSPGASAEWALHAACMYRREVSEMSPEVHPNGRRGACMYRREVSEMSPEVHPNGRRGVCMYRRNVSLMSAAASRDRGASQGLHTTPKMVILMGAGASPRTGALPRMLRASRVRAMF